MSEANRKAEYDRLMALGRTPPEVLVKEFGPKEVPKPKPIPEFKKKKVK